MSGIILFAMPIVMAGVLWVLNEPYVRILIEDEIGRIMALSAGLLMIVGAYVMKNMCDIKV
jgi:Flp pilus assembly protein TadB